MTRTRWPCSLASGWFLERSSRRAENEVTKRNGSAQTMGEGSRGRDSPWHLSSSLSATPRGMHIALKDQLNDRIGDCLPLEFAGNRLRCLERPMLSELVRRQATLADLKIVAALGAGIDATTYRLKSCKEARVARQPLKRAG